MSNPSAIIFDFDGTLTKPYLDFDVIRHQIGFEGPILEGIEKLHGADRLRAEKILDDHEWQAARNASLQDGAKEVVQQCRALGHPTAILTRNARPKVEHVLHRYGLLVDTLRTREDSPTKPSPEPIYSICEELGAIPEQSWMVGDYLLDILTGQRAGSHTVLLVVDRPTPDFAEQAEYVIHHLTGLLPFIGHFPTKYT